MQSIYRTRRGTVQVRLISLYIAVQPRVYNPLDNAECGVKTRGQTVADGMVEVVAEDEVVGVNGGFGREAEGDTVLVAALVVRGEREVGGGVWGGFGEAAVFLGWSDTGLGLG